MWPDLIRERRTLFPILDTLFRDKIKFYFRKFPNEFAGVSDLTVAQCRQYLIDHPDVYVNNFAALKYVQHSTESKKIKEVGSYAYRPNGRFSDWQVHIILFNHKGGTAVLAHREPNPVAGLDTGIITGIIEGLYHYVAPPSDHQPQAGIDKAQELLDLDDTKDFADIVP